MLFYPEHLLWLSFRITASSIFHLVLGLLLCKILINVIVLYRTGFSLIMRVKFKCVILLWTSRVCWIRRPSLRMTFFLLVKGLILWRGILRWIWLFPIFIWLVMRLGCGLRMLALRVRINYLLLFLQPTKCLRSLLLFFRYGLSRVRPL